MMSTQDLDLLCELFETSRIVELRWKLLTDGIISTFKSNWPDDPIRFGNFSNVISNELELVDVDTHHRLQDIFDSNTGIGVEDPPFGIRPLLWGENCFELRVVIDIDCYKNRISFFGVDRKTGKNVFVKLQLIWDDQKDSFYYFRNEGIENEISMLEYLVDVPHTPRIVSYGVENSYKYVITERLSTSFSFLRRCFQWRHGVHVSVKTFHVIGKMHDVSFSAYQLVRLLQRLHHLHILHKDIKPDNICFGDGEFRDQLYLVDYETAWHPSYSATHNLFTPYYASPFASQNSYTPRDEMISLGFMLMSMYCPLPWHDMEDLMTHSERKYASREFIHLKRNEMKSSMFKIYDGRLKFVGNVPVKINGGYVAYSSMLMKPCSKLYHFFCVYFDILFNHGTVSQLIYVHLIPNYEYFDDRSRGPIMKCCGTCAFG